MAFRRLAFASLLAALLQLAAPDAWAQELLQDGGFEQGGAGWSLSGATTSGCEAHAGSHALSLGSGGAAVAQQTIAGTVGAAQYRLTGWLKADVQATVNVALVWIDDAGAELARSARNLTAGTAYAPFALEAAAPANAHGARVLIARGGQSNALVCVDSLSLDGPPARVATPQPQPTATPAPPTLVPTETSSSQGQGSAPGGSSSQPAAASGPAVAFVNGGFEQGLTGWQKFGGELRLVQAAHSGVHAGELFSSTDSTKWAYQTVRISAGQTYEFAGYLRSGPGVSSARLRISWYASPDGSGEALATSDSPAVHGPSGAFVFLTTGAVSPPAGVQTARPRVLLTPLGAGAASLLIDDVSFAAVAVPQPTAQPAETPPAGAQTVTSDVAATPATATTVDPPPEPTGEPARTAEVAAMAAVAPSPGPLTGPLALAANRDEGVPLVWLAAGSVFVAALGGGYLHAKRALGRRD